MSGAQVVGCRSSTRDYPGRRELETALCLSLIAAVQLGADGASEHLSFNQAALKALIDAVPGILKSQDPATGRFGTGLWICSDQNVIYPLAAAWAIESKDNPYYHDPSLLKAIVAGGDALIADADADGAWVFRKKDNSTWGMIRMPWTYSRWIRAFSLIRDTMSPDDRERWEKALTLGYANIMARDLNRVHNIPCHHAMGLYCAGKTLGKPDWCEFAKQFMARVVAAQDPAGFWTEHVGPVVRYNFVYIDALGHYYAMSGDQSVLPALERSAMFHSMFTYPDGSVVETVDERNPYQGGIHLGNVGFTFTAQGRGHIANQLALLNKAGRRMSADEAASFLLFGREGSVSPTPADASDRLDVTPDGRALVCRKGPWFVCISAYHCPVYANRWIQDRQNFVSVYHDRCGLILGGGNTKLQPLWSTFTVGDVSLLAHKPGDENPKFTPDGELYHVPDAAGLKRDEPVGIGLTYGKERCSVQVEPVDECTLKISLRATARSGLPVEAHLTLIPHIGRPFGTALSPGTKLDAKPFTLDAAQTGGWIEHAGWRLTTPEGSRVVWPVLPHDPYKKDGSAEPAQGRIVVAVPLSAACRSAELTLVVAR